MKTRYESPLAQTLSSLDKQAKRSSHLTWETILALLAGKGRFFLLLLLAIPFCQPIQLPGLSTPFGILIGWIGIRTIWGKRRFFPKKWASKKISSRIIRKIAHSTLALHTWIRPLIHTRCLFLFRYPKAHGLLILSLSLLLILPIPVPLSNLAPAWSLFLLSLGILERDGLMVIVSYVLALLAFALFGALLVLSFRL